MLAGAVYPTVADVPPVNVAVPIVGASGFVKTEVAGDVALLNGLLPTRLVAYTLNVYDCPAIKPVTCMLPDVACDSVPDCPDATPPT